MRLFLLPISTRQSLIYCQRLNQQLSTEKTYIDKITSKASTTWLKWERKETGWQKQVTSYGNKLFQRLPYQEWGLKSIPPLSARRQSDEVEGREEVLLEFPERFIEPKKVQDALKVYGSDEKQSFHSKRMWGSIIGMPISAPVALIPVIPNLPFFYLCFRAWSHWRARGGSKHLQFLMNKDLVKISPSKLLYTAYTEAMMDMKMQELKLGVENVGSRARQDYTPRELEEKLLLSQRSGQLIADYVEIPELAAEIQRAVWQVERSLKAQRDLQEEKNDLDSANKRNRSQ